MAPKPRDTDYEKDPVTTTSVRSEKERLEIKDRQEEARRAAFEAPQDLAGQEIASVTPKTDKDKPLTMTVVGQDAYLEIGEARVKIDREQAQQLTKFARRVAAATS